MRMLGTDGLQFFRGTGYQPVFWRWNQGIVARATESSDYSAPDHGIFRGMTPASARCEWPVLVYFRLRQPRPIVIRHLLATGVPHSGQRSGVARRS